MMDLTPLEVRKKKGDFRRQIRGYDPALVDDFLDLVADRLEQLVRENLSVSERTSRLEQQVSDFRERERAMTDALVTAQEMREHAKSLVASESERARTNAERDAERIRIEAESAREHEEESIRRLLVRKAQFLQAFRSFLERELAEIAAEERTVEVDATRSGVRMDRARRSPAPAREPAAAAPAVLAAAPVALAAAPPQDIAPPPAKAEPARVEPSPPRRPEPEPEPEPEPVVAELELSEADIQPPPSAAPKALKEMPPPWSFDEEEALGFGRPGARQSPAVVSSPTPEPVVESGAEPVEAEQEDEIGELASEPIAEVEAAAENADDLEELDAMFGGGEQKDEAFDFDAALASLAARVGATDLGDDLFGDTSEDEAERAEEPADEAAGEILLMDEVSEEDDAVDLLDDLDVEELEKKSPKIGLPVEGGAYDTDDFGAPPQQREPPPLWQPDDEEPSELTVRPASSEEGVRERRGKSGDADDDVDDLLANLFGDGM